MTKFESKFIIAESVTYLYKGWTPEEVVDDVFRSAELTSATKEEVLERLRTATKTASVSGYDETLVIDHDVFLEVNEDGWVEVCLFADFRKQQK